MATTMGQKANENGRGRKNCRIFVIGHLHRNNARDRGAKFWAIGPFPWSWEKQPTAPSFAITPKMWKATLYLAICVVVAVHCQWTMGPSMDYPKKNAAGCSAEGLVYSIGGYYGDRLTVCEVYNPSTNAWTFCADLPSGRAYVACSYAAQRIVVRGEKYQVLTYFPANNSWTAPMDEWLNVDDVCAATVKDISYAAGGRGYSGTSNGCYSYNPVTNKMAKLASMPLARTSLGAAAVGSLVYVAGGMDSGWDAVNTMESFDPAANRWRGLAPLPTARFDLAVVSLNGLVYAIGGRNARKDVIKTVEVYNPQNNTWTSSFSLTIPRASASAAAVGNTIYVYGGESEQSAYLNSMEMFTP